MRIWNVMENMYKETIKAGLMNGSKIAVTLFSLFLCLYVVTSCEDQKVIDFERVELEKKVIDKAVPLKAKILWSSDSLPLAVRDAFVYADSILVVVNSKETEAPFVQVFNLFTHDSIASFLLKGNGHGEILSAIPFMQDNTIIVNDFVKGQVVFLNLDSLLRTDAYSPSVIKYNLHMAANVFPFGNDYLTENPYCFTSEALGIRQGIEYGIPRFLKISDLSKEMSLDTKYRYDTWNVAVDGQILCRTSDLGRVFYANMSKSEVEVYDGNLSLLKRIDGPVVFKESLMKEKVVESGELEEVCFKDVIPYAYMSSCSDSSGVYLNYLGKLFKPNSRPSQEEMQSYIFYFDWDGNLKGSFCAGRRIRSFTRSTVEPETFYATAYDDSMNLCLMKLSAQ